MPRFRKVRRLNKEDREAARARMCDGKNAYGSRRQAEAMIEMRCAEFHRLKLRAYFCTHCKRYHIGHILKNVDVVVDVEGTLRQ